MQYCSRFDAKRVSQRNGADNLEIGARYRNLASILILSIVSSVAAAETTDRQSCQDAVEELGFHGLEYSFEEGGLLRPNIHRFGDLTCVVGENDKVQRIDLNGLALAENGLIGPNLLLLQEASQQASTALVERAKEQRQEAVRRAEVEYESRRKSAYQQEDARLREIGEHLRVAAQSLREGNPNKEAFEKLGVDVDDPRFHKLSAHALIDLAKAAELSGDQEETWLAMSRSYFSGAMDLASKAYADPASTASELKAQGIQIVERTKEGALSTYEAVIEKTGETYELIAGDGVCQTIEVINNKAVSYVGGAASGFAIAAKSARPSRVLLIIQRSYEELTVIRGVGYIQRSVSSGFIATKVVPAIPSTATGVAAAATVVYLSANGACYVTSPEAKEHLQAARSFTFSALDVAKDKAEAIIRNILE